jgi:hypothetical protein
MTMDWRGAMEWHDGKAYGRCVNCGKLIQLNKPVIGSLHTCVPEEPDPPVRVLLAWCIAAQHSKCPGAIKRDGELTMRLCRCECHDDQKVG